MQKMRRKNSIIVLIMVFYIFVISTGSISFGNEVPDKQFMIIFESAEVVEQDINNDGEADTTNIAIESLSKGTCTPRGFGTFYVSPEECLLTSPYVSGADSFTLNPGETVTKIITLDRDVYGGTVSFELPIYMTANAVISSKMRINWNMYFASMYADPPSEGLYITQGPAKPLPHTVSGDDLRWELSNTGEDYAIIYYRWPDTSPTYYGKLVLEAPPYTPTPTWTPTLTPTATPTATPTETSTPTSTPSPTPTPSPTITLTPTPTATPLATVTPTPTLTSTPTPTPVAHFTFDSTTEGWVFAGTIAPYDTPTTVLDPGHLCMCASGSAQCFSFWYSPDISISSDRLYRTRWQVGTTCSACDSVVQFRLRINQKGSWQAWDRIVSSNKEQGPSSGNPKWYDIYLDPNITGSSDNVLTLNFDMMSFDWSDDRGSWLFLEEVIIVEASITKLTDQLEYTFNGGNQGWAFAGTIPPYETPSSQDTGGHLGLNPDGSIDAFSYWFSPDVTIENDTLYRAEFEMSSSTTEIDTAVQFRLRINQKGSWQAWNRIVNSNLGQAPNASNAKIYSVLFSPIVSDTEDSAVIFNFDIMSFDWTDDTHSWIYLESLSLDEVVLEPEP